MLLKDLGTLAKEIPGDFVFDSDYTNAKPLNHIHGLGRAYVGETKLSGRERSNGLLQKVVGFRKSIIKDECPFFGRGKMMKMQRKF